MTGRPQRRKSEVRKVMKDVVDRQDCPLCTRMNSADTDMVECGVCKRWIHFSCAEVDHTVEDRDFECVLCIAREPPVDDLDTVSERSASSSVRARRNLELQRLEEERALKEKVLQEKLQLESDFLTKKYQILQAAADEEGGKGSVRSSRTSTGTIAAWVAQVEKTTLGLGNGNKDPPTTSTSLLGAIPKVPTTSEPAEPPMSTCPSSNPPGFVVNDSKAGTFIYPDVSSTIVQPTTESDAISPLTEQHQLLVSKRRLEFQVKELTEQLQRFQSQSGMSRDNPVSSAGLPQNSAASGTLQLLPLIPSLPSLPPPLTSSSVEPPVVPSVHQTQVTHSTVSAQYGQVRGTTTRTQSSFSTAPPAVSTWPTTSTTPTTLCSSVNATTLSSLFSTTIPIYRTVSSVLVPPAVPSMATIWSTPTMLTSSVAGTVSYNPKSQPYGTTPGIRSHCPPSNPASSTTCSTSIFSSANVARVVGPLAPDQPTVSQGPAGYNWTPGPTPQQLAARHVIPKDLPSFYGEPEEWPLFFSTLLHSTNMCGFSEAENLIRLQKCLKGRARNAVYGILYHPNSVSMIIDTLQTLYGQPRIIVQALLNKAEAVPAPKTGDFAGLRDFGLEVQNLCRMLYSMGMQEHLSNPSLLRSLEAKLPAEVMMKWALHQPGLAKVDIGTFANFMAPIVEAANRLASTKACSSKVDKPKREKAFVNTHSTDESRSPAQSTKKVGDSKERPSYQPQDQPRSCLVCHKEGHRVKDCTTFKGLKLAEKWNQAHELKLCRRCLGRHGKFPCRAPVCGFDGCELRHHKLLHPGNPDNSETSSSSMPIVTVAVHRDRPSSTLFKVVPVVLHGPKSSLETLAFFDDGASLTLVEAELAVKLGLEGDVRPICLQWTGDVTRIEAESQRITVGIAGVCSGSKYVMEEVQTVKSLNLPRQSLDFEDLTERYPYLEGLPVKSYHNETPRILIGLDNTDLTLTRKFREGKTREPVATKSRLGWTVHGKIGYDWPRHRLLHISSKPTDESLHEAVNQFFTLENIGVANVSLVEAEEERRARTILESTTKRTPSGRFETGLLWRYDEFEFPNSRPMAEHRLRCLERRLAKDPELYANVRQQIKDYQTEGYAHIATKAELAEADPRRTWYLPLGLALNPNKPGKVRLVWDAAAKVQGISLNSMLLKGPDLLIPLFAALFRFRQFQIAITGDIRQMFHQVMIRPQDRSAQWFLYRDDPSQPIQTLVMDVATFGATCSPSSVQHVKNKNAEEWRERFPKAAEAIIKGHYMDDYLDSMHSEDEAVNLALEVKAIHAKAGFEIRGWLSNSPSVVQRVGDPGEQSAKKFSEDSNCERVLGMIWLPKEDVFTFILKFREPVLATINDNIVPTKRDALRVVMSVFDPTGVVTPAVVHGKCLIQDIWRVRIGWDIKVPEEIFERWQRWLELLRKLEGIKIPRCYFPGYTKDSLQTLEAHVFVDASESACACAVYFRIIDKGNVRCALVAAKSKVAPIKLLSIPRLELIAALIGTRLLKAVLENHTFQVKRFVMWTDAVTVLSWIRSDHRKYSRFVAFRVSEILDVTDIQDWRWVPSQLNVADDATKWGKGSSLHCNNRWFVGPEFLYEPEEKWPTRDQPPVDDPEEMRPSVLHHHRLLETTFPVARFQVWQKLLRTTAYALRFIDRLRKTPREDTADIGLTRNELQRAERVLFREIQQEAYADEIVILQKAAAEPSKGHVKLGKSSPLRGLSPFLDEDGVLRMEGRIGAAPGVPYSCKFPIILPNNHPGTILLVRMFHRKYEHANGETVYNEIRQQYKIANLRTLIRKVANRCQWCRVYKAKPSTPRMAPLPKERVTPFVRAFTFVGVDFCGPFLIRQGRSLVKRWVMLFTCLTTRAVHLEVASTLSTESCKLCFRRFIAVRGDPKDIYSDCGTNFQGLSKEANVESEEIHRSLAKAFTNINAQWHFNPPAAPHMGGIWERMVRSVKVGLATVSTSRNPDEETFRTYLAEVVAIINSRPLTHVPLETADAEALTPNHFLMLSSSGVVQPTIAPTDPQTSLRCSWNHIQVMLDQFWTRWIKEYLPKINQRPKWFDETRPIRKGDLILIVDEGVRNSWTRARVIKVNYNAEDGRIRNAEVQLSNGKILKRPVVRLALLEVEAEAEGIAGPDSGQYGSGDVAGPGNPAINDLSTLSTGQAILSSAELSEKRKPARGKRTSKKIKD